MTILWPVVIVLHVVAAAMAVGCQPSLGVVCGHGWCSKEEICAGPQAAQPACVQGSCGNGHVDVGEECDLANNTGGEGCSPNFMIERCGNGILDRATGEQCDDHNTMDGDGCTASCELPSCSNGVVDRYGQCDDDNTIDGCVTGCTIEVCGNGILDRAAGEQCDDGNIIDGDGCTASRRHASCSNGVIDPYEQCDDDNLVSGDECSAGCTWEQPGNGIDLFAYIKASNSGAGDLFGTSVALSADGSTLAVGAVLESSAVSGIGGNQANNSAGFAGAAYAFTRSGATWSQQAYIKASNTGGNDEFGSASHCRATARAWRSAPIRRTARRSVSAATKATPLLATLAQLRILLATRSDLHFHKIVNRRSSSISAVPPGR